MPRSTVFNSSSAYEFDWKQQLSACCAVADHYAKQYQALGEAYHELPISVQRHEMVAYGWRDYCAKAFVVEETRELPDMIHILSMLNEQFMRVRSGLLSEYTENVYGQMCVVMGLLSEAQDHLIMLTTAMSIYGWLIQTSITALAVDEWKIAFEQECSKSVDQQKSTGMKWRDALPAGPKESADCQFTWNETDAAIFFEDGAGSSY